MKPMLNCDLIEAIVRRDGLRAAIETLNKENNEIRARYLSGEIDFSEACEMLFRPIVAGRAVYAAGLFWSPAGGKPKLRCYESIACLSQEAYEVMREDYASWRAGSMPDSPDEAPWLFSRRLKHDGEPKTFLEYYSRSAATPEEKRLLFLLHDATFLPVEFFEPTPDGMLVPVDEINLETGAFGNGWWAEGLYCTMNVSGLPSDGRAVGMRVDLPFDGGGIAHLKITGAEFALMPPLYAEPDPNRIEWEAVGWIEGYTCDIERKIDFISEDGLVDMGVHLAQVPDDVERADQRAYRESPIWAPFRSWEVEHWNRWRASVRSAVERFLNSSGNNSDVAGNSDDVNGPGRDLLEER